jgi:hypothetical protein
MKNMNNNYNKKTIESLKSINCLNSNTETFNHEDNVNFLINDTLYNSGELAESQKRICTNSFTFHNFEDVTGIKLDNSMLTSNDKYQMYNINCNAIQTLVTIVEL